MRSPKMNGHTVRRMDLSSPASFFPPAEAIRLERRTGDQTSHHWKGWDQDMEVTFLCVRCVSMLQYRHVPQAISSRPFSAPVAISRSYGPNKRTTQSATWTHRLTARHTGFPLLHGTILPPSLTDSLLTTTDAAFYGLPFRCCSVIRSRRPWTIRTICRGG